MPTTNDNTNYSKNTPMVSTKTGNPAVYLSDASKQFKKTIHVDKVTFEFLEWDEVVPEKYYLINLAPLNVLFKR